MSSRWDQINAACVRVFGESVVYTPAEGEPFDLRAIISPPSQTEEVWPGQHHGLFAEANSFQNPPAHGDAVTIDSTTYTVYDIQQDGGGGIRLALSRQ